MKNKKKKGSEENSFENKLKNLNFSKKEKKN